MAGTAKAYSLPLDYVLYEMSWVNVNLYNAIIPDYSAKWKEKKGKKDKGKKLKADDPRNKEKINKLLDSFD